MIWLISILMSLPLFFMVRFLNEPDRCQLDPNIIHIAYLIGINILIIFIPALILPVLYLAVFKKIRDFDKFLSKSDYFHQNAFRMIQKESNLTTGKNFETWNKNSFNTTLYGSDGHLKSQLSINSQFNPRLSEPALRLDFKNYSLRNSLFASYSNQLSLRDPYRINSTSSGLNFIKKETFNTNLKLNIKNQTFKKVRFIIIVTILFFFCQLPVRMFLCWSYLSHYISPLIVNDTNDESQVFYIDLLSHITTFIYFLHCISNSIIYNVMSKKFRTAFMSIIKNLFKLKFSQN